MPTPERSASAAATLTEGDPTWTRVMAGMRRELRVFHIAENRIGLVPAEVQESQVGPAEIVDTGGIGDALQQVRFGPRAGD